MFVEKFLSKKTGQKVEEPNISSWRRTVSGDLTSAFRPYNGEKLTLPEWLDRDEHVQKTFDAKFKKLPDNFKALGAEDVSKMVQDPGSSLLPKQEPGTKPSNGLKYELYVDGKVSEDGKEFIIRFKAGKDVFGGDSLGSPFHVYAPGKFRNDVTRTWAFAVKGGDQISYRWSLNDFEGGKYHLRVYGPNGFFREFLGNSGNRLEVGCAPVKKGKNITGQLKVEVKNTGKQSFRLRWLDVMYQKKTTDFVLASRSAESFLVETESVRGWYNFSVVSQDEEEIKVAYGGRLESGADSISDPYMGRVV